MSAYSIAKSIGCCKSNVLRALNRWGYDTSIKDCVQHNNLLKDKKDQVIELFKSGKSCNEISKLLNHSAPEIGKLLKKNGYTPTQKIYQVDETFFEKIDTQEKAYILGLIYSDGNIRKGMTGWRLELAEKDKEILEKIKIILKYNGPIYYKKPKNNRSQAQYGINIQRVKMAQDLVKLGCLPAKSLILKFPTSDIVLDHLLHHFIRGIFDGDGSIRQLKNASICICGSYNFIIGLANKMQELNLNYTGVYQRYKERLPENSSHQLFIGRYIDKVAFLRWIYQDASLYIERKRKISKDIYNV